MAIGTPRKGWQESKKYDASRKVIESDCQRFDDLVDGLLEVISTKPEYFEYVAEDLQVAKAKLPDNEGVLRHISIFFRNLPEVIYLVDVVEHPEE